MLFEILELNWYAVRPGGGGRMKKKYGVPAGMGLKYIFLEWKKLMFHLLTTRPSKVLSCPGVA